ncbi:MAG: SufE family protein [Flavobacteriaceae bacterium TMED206]|nr:MAG: SufE family protein [Flavobacteriaceae bacterium TMED206]|tara:strand:+ start:4819 stop:5241 length:423 start_codon:yes stop_codon:yes gene_type:complete
MKIIDIQNQIIDEFEIMDDWMEKYEYMISLGKSLPLMADDFKNDSNLIKGCQSSVWLHAELKNDNIFFHADSDAIITKGIISILIRIYSGQAPKEILDSNFDFINKIGLREHLSQTRANGLSSMIKQIKMYALAFQTKLN